MSTLHSPAPASGFGTCPLLPLSPPSRLIIQRPCSSHTDILYLCIHVCLCAHGSQRSVSGAITQKPSAVFCLGRVSLWNLEFTKWVKLAVQGSPGIRLPSAGIVDALHHIWVVVVRPRSSGSYCGHFINRAVSSASTLRV